MPDKPRWYKTSDMARIYVGPHVENIVFTSDVAQSQRRFVHPGITYTQGDLDRMKAMVEARQRTLLFYLFEIEGVFLFIT